MLPRLHDDSSAMAAHHEGAQGSPFGGEDSRLCSSRPVFSAGIDDVRAAVHPALRHRVLLNFEGEAEGIQTDDVLDAVLKAVSGRRSKGSAGPRGSN